MRVFAEHGGQTELVIHTAAQPSHDWAASDPQTDFGVNANGTLNLLEATRRHTPDATFIFCSTNKVYGDLPNQLPLLELESRLELPPDHRYFGGIDTSMSIDSSTHSLFGVSKASADLLVQEYGRYFGMPTVCFRGGCLTGPNHAGTQLHGFLSYLMRCTMTGEPYTVFGYGGKQVRDNIHAADLVEAFERFHRRSAPGCRLQHRRRAGEQLLDAGGDRAVPGDRRTRADMELRRDESRRRPPLVDQRPRPVPTRLSRVVDQARRARHPAADPRPKRRAVARRSVRLSVVIPAHNERGSIATTVDAIRSRLQAEDIPYEILVVDDASDDGTGEVVRAIADHDGAVRCVRSPRTPRVRPGRPRRVSTSSPATRWRS